MHCRAFVYFRVHDFRGYVYTLVLSTSTTTVVEPQGLSTQQACVSSLPAPVPAGATRPVVIPTRSLSRSGACALYAPMEVLGHVGWPPGLMHYRAPAAPKVMPGGNLHATPQRACRFRRGFGIGLHQRRRLAPVDPGADVRSRPAQ